MRTTSKRVAAGLVLGFSAGVMAQSTPQTGPPPLKIALSSLKPDVVIDAAGDRQITVAPDGVWVSNRTAGTVTRIDPKTNAVGTPVVIGQGPCRSLVVAFKSVWAPLCDGPALARVDASGGKAPPVVIKVGITAAGPVVTATGSIWMITDPAGTLARLDPDTNAVVAEVTVPAGAGALAAGNDALWVTSVTKDVVTRINGHTNVLVETITVGRGPSAIAAGEGSIWSLNGGDGTVSRIDPATNKVTETIKTGVTGTTGAVVVGEGSVWLSAPGAPLTRIDPLTNSVRQHFTGTGGGALAIGLKSLWLAATPASIWRIDPRRVEATRR
jgi:virginiamycin B lyase